MCDIVSKYVASTVMELYIDFQMFENKQHLENHFKIYTRFHIDTHPISTVLQRLPRYTGLWAGWGLGHMLQSWGRFFLCP